ncbi:MAG: hypothetical protein H6929_19995 [Rhodoferax sp.]|nr:hypothetical protein [Rhodoferax sp.]
MTETTHEVDRQAPSLLSDAQLQGVIRQVDALVSDLRKSLGLPLQQEPRARSQQHLRTGRGSRITTGSA